MALSCNKILVCIVYLPDWSTEIIKVNEKFIYFSSWQIQKACSTARNELDSRKGTISQYFTTLHCPVCDELTQHGICCKCRSQPQHVAVILNQEIRELEYRQDQLVKVSRHVCFKYILNLFIVYLNCNIMAVCR